jgi:maltose alpha-D-glucosyltransferase/alpha-amylase
MVDLGAQVVARSLVKTQIHGDYHLGQVLKTDDSFVVVDFEGEPARPLAERWIKQSPLRDVAGMLRSLNYAANAALRATLGAREVGRHAWAEEWEQAAAAAYLGGYREATGGAGLLPEDPSAFDALVRLFGAAKAFYEVRYELDNRPDWVEIPLRGLDRLLGRGSA